MQIDLDNVDTLNDVFWIAWLEQADCLFASPEELKQACEDSLAAYCMMDV